MIKIDLQMNAQCIHIRRSFNLPVYQHLRYSSLLRNYNLKLMRIIYMHNRLPYDHSTDLSYDVGG